MTEPILDIRGVTKAYGLTVANDAVDFQVEPGLIHAVLGENGAGKSTLMKIIYGVVKPDAGTLVWRGQLVSIASPAEARRLGIGMVFQHFSLFETLTVTENISLAVPGSKNELGQRIRAASARFGLDVEPDARVHTLTVGERQRIEILRCILQEPKVIILDEPTSVLPPQGIVKLFETLRNLASEGIAVVFISHKLDEIRALCDTATIMRGGRVVGVVNPKEETSKSLTQLMIGQDIPAPTARSHAGTTAGVLRVQNLDHVPDDPYAAPLSGLDLELRGGEILGIAGVSGNGQGALMRVLAGEIRTAPDTVLLDQKPVGALGPGARRRLGVHFIPEERLGRGAVPGHTLAENAGLTTFHSGLLSFGFLQLRKRRERAGKMITDMDVRCSGPDAAAQSLSGGNLQKFIVSREMALAPRVLIAEQPTWGVDVGAAAAIRQKLLDMRDQGVALLIVSEELEELMEICDRVQVMFRGRLSAPVAVGQTDIEHIGLAMAGDFDGLETVHG
ncbi:ABC transporter ATP-binding protein [uncultured Roseobacter sp.]|uniref:ABC transporter ATP-binding protein n=1 Tax=uncultured Roseobacter sp. TaxID=114847 RepID=UPI002634B93B|nr:ABC transporter ATP-binding protein [uncultured Roseobacter sp.]